MQKKLSRQFFGECTHPGYTWLPCHVAVGESKISLLCVLLLRSTLWTYNSIVFFNLYPILTDFIGSHCSCWNWKSTRYLLKWTTISTSVFAWNILGTLLGWSAQRRIKGRSYVKLPKSDMEIAATHPGYTPWGNGKIMARVQVVCCQA